MKPLLFLLTAATLSHGADRGWVERLAFWSRAEMESLDASIRGLAEKLAVLPEMNPVNSCVRVGLKTGYTTAEDVRWMEVTLKEASKVDAVVLMPPFAKSASAVVAGYGFPVRFKLEVFDEQNAPHVVMDKTAEDFPNPGCFPVVARFDPRLVRRVRFTATEPWTVDGPEVLALAELLVLSGTSNLAIDGVVTSSSSRSAPRAWTRPNLVDMITPLGLPIVPQPGGLRGFHSAVADKADTEKSLTLALPQLTPLDEIRLVPVRRRDVPLWFDYGFPVLYKVEVAASKDFSDAVLLHEVTDKFQPTPGMNLVCIPAHRTLARYVRITARQLWYRKSDYVFALAEMQAIKDGENMAAQGQFTASDVLTAEDAANWSLRALNDGLTEDGRLISLPEWFTWLEHRQHYEKEREALVARREALVEQSQHQLVYGSVGSMGGVTLLYGVLLWRQRRERRRDAQRLHDKLARDLHDEIGSNLGSITLICSIANQPDATPDSLKADIAEIERVAGETADSMRDMVDLISTRRSSAGKDWLGVLHALTERLLRGVNQDCVLPTAPLTLEPDIETRRELYLFCKEVLHNIARHAHCTRVRFHLMPTQEGLRVEITDNGAGFDTAQESGGHGLSNLRERATALRARLKLSSKPGEGTVIHLDVPRGPRWRKPVS